MSQPSTMVSAFGSMLVEKLRLIQGSLAAMAGLATVGSQSEQRGPGNTGVSDASTSEPSGSEVREQHKATMLTDHGIKVRDFAYESKLPPVPSYRPIVKRGPRPLKRTRRDYQDEEEEEDFVLPSILDVFRSRDRGEDTRPSKKAKPLERAPTEPLEESRSQPATGYSDISEIPEGHSALSNSQLAWIYSDPPSTPPQSIARLPRSPLNPIQSPRRRRGTAQSQTMDARPQGSQSWIDTPLLTPNGSLQYHTDGPTSQGPQQAGPSVPRANVSFSSATHTSSQSQIIRPSIRPSLSRTFSRFLSPTRVTRPPSHHQLQIAKSRSRMSMTPRQLSTSSLSSSPPPAPRYHLRDRSKVNSPTRQAVRQHKRSHPISAASSPSRAGGKARSSLSKAATKSPSKAIISPNPKPALRRSARHAGIRL